nr:unnamed protein product [Digitaria exilis]
MSGSELSRSTVVFGLRMWVLVGVGVGAAFVLLLVLISVLCLLGFRRRRRHRPTNPVQQLPTTAPPKNPANTKSPKDIREVPFSAAASASAKPQLAQVLQLPTPQVSEQIVAVKENRITYPEQQRHPSHRSEGPSPHGSDGSRGGGVRRGGAADHATPVVPEVSHLGWGHWYTLKELETATGMFSDENVIGEGGYGIVYHGVLENGTQVAVKNLLNNRGQAEKEFKVEVEAIGRVRHKNLVRLLGYCAEGNQRMLVYEYVNNGNLEQWLHGEVGPVNLVDWLKTMVSTRNSDGVVDPKIPKKPTSRAVKKALLVALRCVDPDASKRPKIGHVIHMLEVDDFPYREDRRGNRAPGQARAPEKPAGVSGDHETDSITNGATIAEPFRWRNPDA